VLGTAGVACETAPLVWLVEPEVVVEELGLSLEMAFTPGFVLGDVVLMSLGDDGMLDAGGLTSLTFEAGGFVSLTFEVGGLVSLTFEAGGFVFVTGNRPERSSGDTVVIVAF